MATVEPGYASWLKAPARMVGATVAGAAGSWGDLAVDSSITSPLAFKEDAQAEASAQAQFLAGPMARDTLLVEGLRKDLIGRAITVFGDRLDYDTGPTVFVIGADEQEGAKLTVLTVLKRLY